MAGHCEAIQSVWRLNALIQATVAYDQTCRQIEGEFSKNKAEVCNLILNLISRRDFWWRIITRAPDHLLNPSTCIKARDIR